MIAHDENKTEINLLLAVNFSLKMIRSLTDPHLERSEL